MTNSTRTRLLDSQSSVPGTVPGILLYGRMRAADVCGEFPENALRSSAWSNDCTVAYSLPSGVRAAQSGGNDPQLAEKTLASTKTTIPYIVTWSVRKKGINTRLNINDMWRE